MSKRKRKPTRKLYPSEVIRRLNAIEKRWPDGFMLFAETGSLCLVREETLEILESFSISCDGGDAGSYTDKGKEYLDL